MVAKSLYIDLGSTSKTSHKNVKLKQSSIEFFNHTLLQNFDRLHLASDLVVVVNAEMQPTA